jgi:hypothetical protein
MKTILKILIFLWVAFWLFIGVGSFLSTPKQIEKDKAFVAERIQPSVEFIKTFKTQHQRLPSKREFYSWERDYHKDYTSDLKLEVDSLINGEAVRYIRYKSDLYSDEEKKFSHVDWANNYMIAVWSGEWMEYYYSWSDTYDTNNFSWMDGSLWLVTYCALAALPLALWRLYSKRRQRLTRSFKQ